MHGSVMTYGTAGPPSVQRLVWPDGVPLAASRRAPQLVSFTRGRPGADAWPAAVSIASIACQPSQLIACGADSATSASMSSATGRLTRPAATSSRILATVSWESFLFVPITPDGPRLIQPDTYSPMWCEPSV